MTLPLRVLMVTSGWPEQAHQTTHFVKRQAEFLRRAGVDVDVVAFRARMRLSVYLHAWREVRRRLATRRYDLVHAQFGNSGVLALGTGLPTVVTLRGDDLQGVIGKREQMTLKGYTIMALSRLVARRADAVVVVSSHMRERLPRGVDATVIPSGLDLELFRPIARDDARRRLGMDPNGRFVLFAGNPGEPRKRYWLAERTVGLLSDELRAQLVVAWRVPHQDMPYLMSACDALLFTSMQEGSPNVVKEALACNLPVVSVPIGDVAERLRGVDGCELVQDAQAEALAGALARVLRRGGRVDGRAAVSALDERRCTERLLAVYRRVLDRRTARGVPLRPEEPSVAATA
jgi:teichuronic acid biosynthesis glycosyltransferase TuaC